MTNIDPSIRLALGLAAARAIRADLPADGYGNLRRLQDDADLWGVAARDAILNSPEFAAAVDAARAEGYEQARKVAIDYFADMGDVWGGSRSWLTTGDHVAELVQGCLREAFEEAAPHD